MKKMDHQRDPKYKFNFQKHHQMTAFHAITRAVTQYRIGTQIKNCESLRTS